MLETGTDKPQGFALPPLWLQTWGPLWFVQLQPCWPPDSNSWMNWRTVHLILFILSQERRPQPVIILFIISLTLSFHSGLRSVEKFTWVQLPSVLQHRAGGSFPLNNTTCKLREVGEERDPVGWWKPKCAFHFTQRENSSHAISPSLSIYSSLYLMQV